MKPKFRPYCYENKYVEFIDQFSVHKGATKHIASSLFADSSLNKIKLAVNSNRKKILHTQVVLYTHWQVDRLSKSNSFWYSDDTTWQQQYQTENV